MPETPPIEYRSSPGLHNILRLLEELNITAVGSIIFGSIQEMLASYQGEREKLEQAYGRLLNSVLSILAAQLPQNTELQTQLKVLARRLSPPLSQDELAAVQCHLAELFGAVPTLEAKNTEEYQQSLGALLDAFAGEDWDQVKRKAKQQPPPEVELDHSPHLNRKEPSRDQREPVERQVDAAYRHHLEHQHDEFSRIEKEFAQTLHEAIDKSDAFSRVLDSELLAISGAGTLESLEARRNNLIEEMQALRSAHQHYADGFHKMNSIVEELDAGNRKLTEELNRVRMLSMTDELTGLHNRRAFNRRLEEEIARAERYAAPVSVVVLDLDYFKEINDQYGHRIGDMVLKLYAKDIFSIFRQHDMVARYGGEEFAVILPNTTIEGGLCAIAKVQRRVNKVICRYQGQKFKLPTFSAGIAQYCDGEQVSALVQRADEAMYRAKNSGRNSVAIATTPVSEDSTMALGRHTQS